MAFRSLRGWGIPQNLRNYAVVSIVYKGFQGLGFVNKFTGSGFRGVVTFVFRRLLVQLFWWLVSFVVHLTGIYQGFYVVVWGAIGAVQQASAL